MHTHVIILKELKAFFMVNIQLFFSEYKLKDLMVREHLYMNTTKVMPPNLK